MSSTFRDMQAEREELVKRVFPEVRRLCERRGVAWSEIDLRWGVTDEQKAEGAVLPICLAEIERSRPYFIGLLGDRYGWVPDELPADLTRQLGWLADAAGRSVTEMEILHGVLNDPDAAGHAFFYLRDPAWAAAQPDEARTLLVDDDPEPQQKLAALKARVRASGHPVRDYPDPVALGGMVLADLTALVEAAFPEEETPDPLDRDAADHAAFAAARRARHLDRPQLRAVLDGLVEGTGAPVVVTGPAGSGASALVAAWVDTWRTAHPDDVVVAHHVAATTTSADWKALARRLVGELARGHGWEGADGVPDDAAGARTSLFTAIGRAGTETRRTVLVVDDADLLEDSDGAPDLTWLPPAVPARVRVVLTTAGGRPLGAAQHHGWDTLEIPPLDAQERRALVVAFLGRYSKALDEVHVARLAAAEGTGNELYLRTVLDELRQHGDHFTLGDVIEHYLAAATVDDLIELVFARYERDYERDRPGLVGDALRAIWAARRGVTEAELLDVLGQPDAPLPRAEWSPLFLAAEEGLVTRSGHLGFASVLHRQAVEDRYLPAASDRAGAHARLAAYFGTHPLGPRVVDELPWQQLDGGDPDALFRTLSDPAFTDLAYSHDHTDLRRLWARAEAAGHRVVDGYRSIVDDPATEPEAVWAVARLVTDAGYPTEAVRLHRFLVEHHRSALDRGDDLGIGRDRVGARLRASLVNLGSALWSQGELDGAEGPLREAIDRARAAADDSVLRPALGNLALVLRDTGRLDEATVLFGEDEALARAVRDVAGLQASLGNQAALLARRGDATGALAKVDEMEELCRSVGDAAGLARAKVARAAVTGDRSDPADRLAEAEAFAASALDQGDLQGQTEALLTQATTLRELGRFADSDARASDGEVIARRTGDASLLARLLDARARNALDQGQWAAAAPLAHEAALTARSADLPPVLRLALSALGIAQRELGDLASARATHTEEEQISTALGDPAAVATAQCNLAACDIAANDLASALARYAAAEPVLREQKAFGVLLPLLNNRAQIHAHQGDAPAAIDDLIAGGVAALAFGAHAQRVQLLTSAIELLHNTGRAAEGEPVWIDLADACRTVGDAAGLQRALGERALMLIGRQDLAGAVPLLDEQEEICRRTADPVGLAACVGNRAIVLRHQGDLVGSLACIDEQLAVSQASGNGQGVLFATANRGEVLGAMGRVPEGITALEEARRMATEWNLTPMVAQLDQMLAALRAQPS